MGRQLNNIRNHKNWLSYLGFKYFGGKKPGFDFATRNGLTISVPRRMLHTYKECFFDECYFTGFPEIDLSQGKPVVVDIGANVGYFSLFILSKNKQAQVYAYEPMPNNFSLLKSYKDSYPALTFHITNKAVASEVGTLTLTYDSSDDYTTSASIFQAEGNQDEIQVPTTTLKIILEEQKFDHIDLLKVDCEGAEYDILYNATSETLGKVKRITVETHTGSEANENMASLVSYLSEEGFQVNTEGNMIWGYR